MSDDLERRLAESLQAERLPDAPDTLRAFLDRLPAEAQEQPPEPRLRLAWLAPALVVVVVAALVFALVPHGATPPASSAIPSSTASGLMPTPTAGASGQPLAGVTVYTASFISPRPGWSPDGSLLAATEEASTEFTVHVFNTANQEVWHHPGRFAAWLGPDRLALLVQDASDRTQTHLSIVTLSSGHIDNLPGTYGAFMLAAPDGTLAVQTDAGFALVRNGPTATYDGNPLTWSPDGHLLAFGTGTDRLHQEMLSILDVASGHIRQTGLRISDQGVTWDRSGTRLVVCVLPGPGYECRATLVDAASGASVESPVQGYYSGAAQIADGRWVLWTDPAAYLWDPAHPETTTALGYGLSVTPDGTLAVFEPPLYTPSGSVPVPLPPLPGVSVHRFATPLPTFLAWTPSGDRVAYTEETSQHTELKVAVSGLAQRHDNAGSSQVPALTVDHPQVVVTPATGLKDGQSVTVSVTGFGVGGEVRISECSSSVAASDIGCGTELAAQTLLVTGDDRAGSASFVVRVNAPTQALLPEPTARCTNQCVIVATLGGGYPFVVARIAFAGG